MDELQFFIMFLPDNQRTYATCSECRNASIYTLHGHTPVLVYGARKLHLFTLREAQFVTGALYNVSFEVTSCYDRWKAGELEGAVTDTANEKQIEHHSFYPRSVPLEKSLL